VHVLVFYRLFSCVLFANYTLLHNINIAFAPTLHIGDRSSIRNLRTRHAVVTGTHLSWKYILYGYNYIPK